ncbi:hypothetical protein [Nocardia jiangsuensis]|uniref:Uncharacterized protein n=1 Tax=Nocardia jiangsuensis TaxID=1691563 RepID=A0ABV8DTU2_9NOCA
MTVTIEHVTTDELHRRRAAVLARVGLNLPEITELAAQYMLTPEEPAAWNELKSIDFLLGDE